MILSLHGTCALIVTLFAALVSTSQIADSIRDNGDGSLLRKLHSSSTHAAPLTLTSESVAVVAVSKLALCAPDAHPDATNALLAFIGVPIPSVVSTGSDSVVSPDDLPPPSSPRRPRPSKSRDSDDATKLPLDAQANIDDFAQFVLPFLQRQQQLQEQHRQCVQDSIFYISVMEAATFLKHVAVLSAFLISCCLVPWRLPTILRLVFKTNDTIKRFQALNACHLLSLVAAQRPEMIAISVQRMHSGIRSIASEQVMDDLQRLASHVTGCGRVQTVYERLMTQVRSVLKKTDADGYDVALSLVKAHDDSMRLLQLHALHYVHELHDLTIAAKRSAAAEAVSAESRRVRGGILLALARSGAEFGAVATQSVQSKSSEASPAPLPSHTEAVRPEEVHRLDAAGLAAGMPFVLDDASLNHIDQQARVATIVAAHFAQSETEFAGALQKLRDREQQLQVCDFDIWRNILKLTLHRLTIRRRNGLCRTR